MTAAPHPTAGSAELAEATDPQDAISLIRRLRNELFWCAKQLEGKGIKGHSNEGLGRILRDSRIFLDAAEQVQS